jgi:hypothetical protein
VGGYSASCDLTPQPAGITGPTLLADGTLRNVARNEDWPEHDLSVPQLMRKSLAKTLGELYLEAGLSRGCPDLVIWNAQSQELRLVEVKCPHWDRPSRQQDLFMGVAARRGIPTEVVEWEFV